MDNILDILDGVLIDIDNDDDIYDDMYDDIYDDIDIDKWLLEV